MFKAYRELRLYLGNVRTAGAEQCDLGRDARSPISTQATKFITGWTAATRVEWALVAPITALVYPGMSLNGF